MAEGSIRQGISAWYREAADWAKEKLIRVYQGLAMRLGGLQSAPEPGPRPRVRKRAP
ncbi:MAG: hypothetical protein K0R89_596 [Ramlibacter sp.]|nr:hypothetical protein [Ramlibacter sp.]